jgi:putative ATP-dependent endonuclease of OLD family
VVLVQQFQLRDMKLTRIRVKNLRCIEDVEIHIRKFTSLIGPNNCGKSSVIRAIELLLNQVTPAPEEWRSGHRGGEIIIEADFDEIQEWERNTPGVAGIIHNNQIKLRMRAGLDPDTQKVETVYEALVPKIEIQGWSDSWGELAPEIRAKAEAVAIKGTGWKTVANKERVRQKVREEMPERVRIGDPIWTSENISIKPALQQALPQAQIVPAVRDAADDAKPGAKTSFGLLLAKIILPAVQSSNEYQRLLEAVDQLRAKLGNQGPDQIEEVRELSEAISARLSSMIDARVRVTMEPPDAQKFVGSNTLLRLDDGTDTSIGLQGHGLQRSLIFALIEVLASQEARREDGGEGQPRSRSTMLLFEEPELFFHPHIMRRLKRALQSIAQKADWQVMVSTHSPFLIDVGEDPISLVIFRRPLMTTPPSVTQLTVDPFGDDQQARDDREALRAVLNFHPTVCEAFFASRTVLVEGDSELAVLLHQPKLYELAGVNLNQRTACTLVSCSGKWTIPPMANLLTKFQIPFRIIHDKDAKSRTVEELSNSAPIDPYRANARIAQHADVGSIHVVDDTLEDLLWVERPSSSGDKPYRAWRRISEICDTQQNLNEVPRLRDLLRFAFNW